MASAVEAAVAEVTAAIADLDPKIEGLRDFSRLNLGEAAAQAVALTLGAYEERRRRLVQCGDACRALLETGYPVLQHEDVSPAVFAELQDNLRTISLALGQFGPIELATRLGLHAGTPAAK